MSELTYCGACDEGEIAEGSALVQISSVSLGFWSGGGVDVAREAAQPAEMTKNDAASRTPNNFFMSAPFRSNPAHPRFSEEFTARRRWIEVKELFEDSFR